MKLLVIFSLLIATLIAKKKHYLVETEDEKDNNVINENTVEENIDHNEDEEKIGKKESNDHTEKVRYIHYITSSNIIVMGVSNVGPSRNYP